MDTTTPTRTPSAVRIIRWCAAVQVAVAATTGVVSARSLAALEPEPNSYAELAQLLLGGAAALAFFAALAVGVPAAIVGRHRPGARIALITGELVTGIPVALGFLAAMDARGQEFTKIVLGLFLAAAVGAVVALFQPAVVAFTADRC